jgi:tRNA A-37 threonylcarbamoyl transferase component Bud32
MPGKISWTINAKHGNRFSFSVLNDIITKDIVSKEAVKRELAGRRTSLLSLKPENLPDVYLKEFTILPKKIIRTFLFPYGLKEWRTAIRLKELNVPTYSPIAFGIEKKYGAGGKIYFISEKIPDALTVKEFLNKNKNLPVENRKSFIKSFSDFILTVHRAGVVHMDFHWKNILVSPCADGKYLFYLVDLERVKLKKVISVTQRFSNLAMLNSSFYQSCSVRDRIAFLNNYLKGFIKKDSLNLRVNEIIMSETNLLLLKKWKKHAKRCFRENKYFTMVENRNLKGYAVLPLNRDVLNLMENPDKLFSDPASIILKEMGSASSLLFPSLAGSPGIYLKRYNLKSIFDVIKNIFRSSHGKKTWLASNILKIRGIPTPEPILFMERRKSFFVLESYIVTEPLFEAKPLNHFMDLSFNLMIKKNKLQFIKEVAIQVKQLHDCGIMHCDLKATNILVNAGDKIKIYFTDLDAIKVSDSLLSAERAKDLARLNCSFLDTAFLSKCYRLYFLKSYLGRVKRKELKKYWDSVTLFTELKLEKSKREFT